MSQEKEDGFDGCLTELSIVGSFIWCGYLAPVEWRWFVFLTFTVVMTVVCILNVQNKKKYGTN